MTTASTSSNNINFASSGTTANINNWSYPGEFLKFEEFTNRVEVTYKQHRIINTWPAPPDQERVYKIIFSCKDGVWHKSDPIYGKVIPPQEETYEFEDNEQ